MSAREDNVVRSGIVRLLGIAFLKALEDSEFFSEYILFIDVYIGAHFLQEGHEVYLDLYLIDGAY